MFSHLAFTLAAVASAGPAIAQAPPADLAGTYDGSQMEVGAELRLEADGRFEYYLSYGALDEMAKGTWQAADRGIVLTSDPVTAPAFELVGTDEGPGKGLDVTLELPGDIPVQMFEAAVRFADGSGTPASFEQDGVHFKVSRDNPAADVMLAFPVYQIVSEPFPVQEGTQAMHFRFVPNDLGSVAFDHQMLPRDGDSFVLERFDRKLRFHKEAAADAGDIEQPAETEEK